jgi:hypothetical protein
MSAEPQAISFATVLPGAKSFKDQNVNETFRGQLLVDGGRVVGAVIKDLESKQLANELLSFTLARAAGLPIPDAYLAVVRGTDLPLKKAPFLSDGNRIVFKAPNVTFRLLGTMPAAICTRLKELIEWDDLGRLYAFDSWIANVDRHPGNLLLSGDGKVWLIDHGHSFSGPSWQIGDLLPSVAFRNRLAEWLTRCLTTSQRSARCSEAAKFAQGISAIDAVASSSAACADQFLATDELLAVNQFLVGRTANVARERSAALGVPMLV